MEPALSQWVSDAVSLPLAFAQVREDPRLDLTVCAGLPANATGVMVASGGDTAVCLARKAFGRLILVDMNPAQLALSRCKLHLARHGNRRASMEWLGHLPLEPELRRERIAATLDALNLQPDAMGPLDRLAASGPDFSGRYEVLFAALHRALAPSWDVLEQLMESPAPVSVPELPQLDAAFAEILSIENLVALFGRDATQNPRMPFAQHFAGRVRRAFEASAPRRNPFLWQMLAGRFPSRVAWDWLDSDAPLLVEPEFVHSMMKPALDAMAAQSVDFVHLSNILDWLSPQDACAVLESAARVLKRGGRVIVRQLNSSLDIPELGSSIFWQSALSRKMSEGDRSFFYPEIHVGSVL